MNNKDGQITVFLSMMFIVLLGIIFCVLECVHTYMEASLAKEAVLASGNEILANYDRYIFQKYHVFFLDPREKSVIEKDGQDFIDHYTNNPGFYGFHCTSLDVADEKTAVDEKGEFLLRQIDEYMDLQRTANFYDSFSKLLKTARDYSEVIRKEQQDFNHDDSNKQEQGHSQSQETDSIKEKDQDGTEDEESRKYQKSWSELVQALNLARHSGVLLYALDNPGALSDLSIDKKELPSERVMTDFSETDPGYLSVPSWYRLKEWKSFLNSVSFDESPVLTASADEKRIQYLFQCFSCFGDAKAKDQEALHYEIEYLIAGKDNDRDNLRIIADRILLTRFLINYSFARSSSVIREETGQMADKLTGNLGFPEGKEAVQTLLTAALCYGESILELHTLLNGGKAALTKNASNWNLSFDNAADVLKTKKAVKGAGEGASYKDYLSWMVCHRLKKPAFPYRMMDIMECNAKLYEPGFRMADCLFSFRLKAMVSCSRWFTYLAGEEIGNGPFFTVNTDNMVSY